MTATCIVCRMQTTARRTVESNDVELSAPVCEKHDVTDQALVNVWMGKPGPQELLADLRRVADELGQSPTLREYDEHGSYSYGRFNAVFGSWNQAKEEADLEKCDTGVKKIPDDVILADVRRVADEMGKPPTMSEYGRADDRPVTMTTIYDRWDSWDEVLEAALGLTA